MRSHTAGGTVALVRWCVVDKSGLVCQVVAINGPVVAQIKEIVEPNVLVDNPDNKNVIWVNSAFVKYMAMAYSRRFASCSGTISPTYSDHHRVSIL